MNANNLNAEMDYKELNVEETANIQSMGKSIMMSSTTATGVFVGPESTRITCHSCKAVVFTRVKHKSTSRTHLIAILMSLCFPFCCLPYCIDSCRNANHYCPSCDSFLGTYQSLWMFGNVISFGMFVSSTFYVGIEFDLYCKYGHFSQIKIPKPSSTYS